MVPALQATVASIACRAFVLRKTKNVKACMVRASTDCASIAVLLFGVRAPFSCIMKVAMPLQLPCKISAWCVRAYVIKLAVHNGRRRRLG